MKVFTLYMSETPKNVLSSYVETEAAINRGDEIINTTQVMLCSTSLFDKGYRIFVQFKEGDITEIKLGDNERTNQEIRMGHNLPNLIIGGEFNRQED